ncbi:protein ARV1-like [Amphiura filiformis]|uniref:protein ARV1-like n=1 Tax=Amphiura filiformis TaxID=82378 RepID=UPI003B218CAC
MSPKSTTKLFQGNCEKVADKYIEYDPVIILLDALLFKPQAFRHILFNTQFTYGTNTVTVPVGTPGRSREFQLLELGRFIGNCEKVADKYIEYDPVIILLDALLFKPQAFRHILFNTQFTFHWKLSVVCLLCDAYTKWARLSVSDDPSTKHFLYYALQWGFYAMFLVAGLELFVFLLGVIIPVKFFISTRNPQQIFDLNILLKALLLSCCGKLLVIPAVLWGQTDVETCLWLTKLFIFTASCQAVRVTLDCDKVVACAMVMCGFLAELTITGLSQKIEGALMRIS